MIYVLYHDPCVDGFASAYAAWFAMRDQAKYIGVSHGQPLPEIKNCNRIIILDFCYPRQVLQDLLNKCEVIVIDHHRTAREELEAVKGLTYVKFDMNHSGARLTWDYFNGSIPRHWFIDYVEDRDLFKNKLDFTHEIAAALSLYPKTFEDWELLKGLKQTMITQGLSILQYRDSLVANLANDAKLTTHGKFEGIPTVNVPAILSSDIGNYLLRKYPEAPFIAMYQDISRSSRKWSLHSNKVDVSRVVLEFGGTGHKNVAGYVELL